jgi:hypothetical protein
MRKAIVTPENQSAESIERKWLDLIKIARVEITSEDPTYPIESALSPSEGSGWRASKPGSQTIRLLFDEPLQVRLIHLEFHEKQHQRVQEFVLRWSPDDGGSYREIVRQQYNFAPPDTCREDEDYSVNLAGVTVLELTIVPEIGGGGVLASLASLRIA